MKKRLLLLVISLLVIVMTLTGCDMITQIQKNNLMKQAASVFTIDVNPSIRIYVDADGNVIKAESVNQDGEEVVESIDIDGQNLDDAIEKILDKFFESGYLEDTNSVLISIEKNAYKLSEKINEKINKTFEKHGKDACIISQELDELEKEAKKHIEDIAKKHGISEGKANIIDKILKEFPEFSEQELASLNMRDLSLMLEGISSEAKESFDKVGEALDDIYVGADKALEAAMADTVLSEPDLIFHTVYLSRAKGKMSYKVILIALEAEYEYDIDAESGVILEKVYNEWSIEELYDKLEEILKNNSDKIDEIFDKITGSDELKDLIFGSFGADEQSVSKTEAIMKALEQLDIIKEDISDTDVEVTESKTGKIISVTVEMKDGTVYSVAVDGKTGAIIKVETKTEGEN